jgi:hypothetical protein
VEWKSYVRFAIVKIFVLEYFEKTEQQRERTKSQIIASQHLQSPSMTSASSQASSLKAIAKATYETLLVQG